MDMTMWDKIPEEMQLYLSRNGKHFNKRLCEFAVGRMRKKDKNGNPVRLTPVTRDETEAMLAEAGYDISDYDAPFDAVYVANMANADYMGSSLEDRAHVAKYVNDTLADPDAYEGQTFNRWLADMAGRGVWIDWEKMV